MGGLGGASGDDGGGAGGAGGKGGVGGGSTGGASGVGGSGNAGGASGNGGAAGASAGGGGAGTAGVGGAAGTGGSTFDGGRVPCVVDQDCPPVACPAPPCPEPLCVMGEGVHRCVTRVHPPYGSCAGYPDSGVCCTDDAQCTGQARGYCIPYSYGPSCVQNLQIPPPPPGNRCLYDACTSDLDCTDRPNGLCTADFPRTCLYGPCRTNDDCNRRAGGKCVLGVACEWFVTRVAFCRYADDPCRTSADCIPDSAGTMTCVPNDDLHGTRCKNLGPPPP
jgi:hypothetical protein